MQATLSPSSAPARRTASAFVDEIEALRGVLVGHEIVSKSRCVDGLLDLYNATIDPAARRLIERTLSDIRFTNAVRTEELRRSLDEIDDAALVDHALEA
jgi:hypothetical protein